MDVQPNAEPALPVVPVVAPAVDPVALAGGTDTPSAGHALQGAVHGNRMGWGYRRNHGIAKTISNAEKAHWGPSEDLKPKTVVPPPAAPPMITGTPVDPLDVSTDPLVQNERRRAREGRGT